MAIDTVTEPCIVAWASARPDLTAAVAVARAAGYDPGDAAQFARAESPGSDLQLRWELAYNHYAQPLPGGGIVPFLISWDPECADILPPNTAVAGLTLTGLRAESPSPAEVAPLLSAVGLDAADVELAQGPKPRIIATLDTPLGPVELG